jgi:hypothetical protein
MSNKEIYISYGVSCNACCKPLASCTVQQALLNNPPVGEKSCEGMIQPVDSPPTGGGGMSLGCEPVIWIFIGRWNMKKWPFSVQKNGHYRHAI